MEGLKAIPYLFLVLAVSGVIGGATLLSMSKFKDTVTICANSAAVYNATNDQCMNSSHNGWLGNFTTEYQAILDAQEGSSTVAEQLPTVGIIAVMVIIISVIAGVFVYLRYFS